MRLSEWQQAAPTAEAMTDRVVSILVPALADLGAEPNPECWVAWGEYPDLKYSILAPTPAGLIYVAIRMTTPIEGPRVTAKLIRWPKVAIGELSLESTSSYRMVAVQVEGLVIKGMDEEADRICTFVRGLIAGTDGRQQQMTPAIFMGALPGAPVTATVAPASPRQAPVDALPALPSGNVDANPRPEAESEPEPAAAGDSQIASRSAPARTAKGGLLKTIPGQPAEGSPERPADAAVPTAATASPTTPPGASPAAAPHAESPTPRPIATRAAKASAAPEPKPAGKEPPPDPAQVETEQDRARWVGPHPIGDEQARRQEKPRWMP